MAGKLPVGEFDRLALVTRDYAKTAQAFAEYLGIRNWRVRRLRSGDGAAGFVSAIGENRVTRIELIQPTAGRSPYQSFLDTRGEGMSHIVMGRLATPARTLQVCAELGLPVTDLGEIGGARSLFINSRERLCGVAIQLRQHDTNDGYGTLAADELLELKGEALLPVDRLYHIGTVVRNREAAQAAFHDLLGFTDWVELELHTGQGMTANLRGKSIDHHARIAFSRQHGLSFELMEPGAGQGLYQEFLATQGEGMQHFFPTICTPRVFAAALPKLRAKGWQPLLTGEFEGLMAWHYLNTAEAMAGLCIEIICPIVEDWLGAMHLTPAQARQIGVV